MNKDKSEQQSQQGIVEFEKEFERLYASVPSSHYWYISARNFVQQRLKEQAQHTRKETLEEAIELINSTMQDTKNNTDTIALAYNAARAEGREKLQSLINKQ